MPLPQLRLPTTGDGATGCDKNTKQAVSLPTILSTRHSCSFHRLSPSISSVLSFSGEEEGYNADLDDTHLGSAGIGIATASNAIACCTSEDNASSFGTGFAPTSVRREQSEAAISSSTSSRSGIFPNVPTFRSSRSGRRSVGCSSAGLKRRRISDEELERENLQRRKERSIQRLEEFLLRHRTRSSTFNRARLEGLSSSGTDTKNATFPTYSKAPTGAAAAADARRELAPPLATPRTTMPRTTMPPAAALCKAAAATATASVFSQTKFVPGFGYVYGASTVALRNAAAPSLPPVLDMPARTPPDLPTHAPGVLLRTLGRVHGQSNLLVPPGA